MRQRFRNKRRRIERQEEAATRQASYDAGIRALQAITDEQTIADRAKQGGPIGAVRLA